MVRCGLAIVETDEILALSARGALGTLFSDREIRESGSRRTTLAGKLAAKRALEKALGCRLSFSRISVVREATGKPVFACLPDRLAARLRRQSLTLSISHTDTLAVAFCLVYDRAGGAIPKRSGQSGRRGGVR